MYLARVPTAFRRVYSWLWLGTIVVRLPWWIIANWTRAQRPRKSWSLLMTVGVKYVRAWVHNIERCNMDTVFHIPSHHKLEVGNGVRGVYVDGAPELITGKVKEWAEKADVECARLPGYWMHKKGLDIAIGQEPDDNEKVVYHLHGGAYLYFSAHPTLPTSGVPLGILQFCPSIKRAFSLEYRLSSVPPEPASDPFPSALIDAISGYNYLVNHVGYKPSQIVLAGDSAGGNLALALVRYLVEYKGAVPNLPEVPGALVLLSPWADMSGSHSSLPSSFTTNFDSDIIAFFKVDEPYQVDAPHSFISPFGKEFASQTPYISPACKHLKAVGFDGFPRTFITAGDAEVLLDQIRELSRRMKSGMGEEKVVYYEARDACHDCLTLSFAEPERTETLKAIDHFIEDTA